MEIIKYDDVIELKDNDKVFKMYYSQNGNLSWNIWVKGKEISYWDNNPIINFEITKNDIELYNSFEELFNNIKNCCLFNEPDAGLKYSTEYKYLYHNNVIEWYSNKNKNFTDCNSVIIMKQDDKYIVNFYLKESKNLDTSIRFNSNDSHYGPFGLIFINQFDKLSKLSVVEEKAYQKKLKK